MDLDVAASGPPIFVGLDGGGTHTRAVVVTSEGSCVGQGRVGASNPNVVGWDEAIDNVHRALRLALEGLEAGRVRGVVCALAGVGPAGSPEITPRLDRVRDELRLTCPYRLVPDVQAAFAAGTAEHSGIVAVAGTGAVAAYIGDNEIVDVAGGHGWLLGDEGSGFWLGREAVRHALRDLERGTTTPDALTVAVCAHYRVSPLVDELLLEVYARPPTHLADLAPLVSQLAERGHAPAGAIVDGAAMALTGAIEALKARVPSPYPVRAVVLAGGVVAGSRPYATKLESIVHRRLGMRPTVAADGVAGAAWLALRDTVEPSRRAEVHAQLRSA